MPSNETLEAALYYLNRGWSVIPGHAANEDGFCTCRQDYDCDRPGKHPRVRWSEFKDRRPTEGEVRRWFTRPDWQPSTVIIITGRISNLVVLDVDPRHGGDESLRDWEQKHEELPLTPRSLTGGGGVHYLFAYPEEDVETVDGFLPGLDVRSDGNGYIVAPPSPHMSGRAYAWDTEAHIEDTPLAPWPKALHDEVKFRYRGGQETGKKEDIDLDGIITGTVKVPEGSRNQVLARVVGYLLHSNQAERTVESVLMLTMGVVERSFEAGNKPLTEAEVKRTVESILRRDARKKQNAAKADHALRDKEVRIESEDMGTDDRVEMATSLWAGEGVKAVTDWYVMIDGGAVEYILLTPEDEIRLGDDLLDYMGIRRILLNRVAILLPEGKKPPLWDRRMLLLRQLARVEQVEATRASEVVEEWVEDYLRAQKPPVNPDAGQRREWLQGGAIIVEGEIWLRPQHLARYVEITTGEKLEPRRIARMLRRAGWENGSIADGEGSSIRGWHRRVK